MHKFTRRQTLAGLALGTTLALKPSPVSASVKKQYDLIPLQVADDVWMVEGATEYFTGENGGAIVNCVLIKTSVGMVIVDTGPSLRYGQALREIAAQLSPIGIATVINTHHHPDHFFGNQVFKDQPMYALAKTKKLAETEGDGFSDNMYRLLGDWMRGTEVTPPNAVFNSSATKIGDREFKILPLEGHTASDLALVDIKTGTLIAGDLAFLNRAPTTPHADIKKWLASITSLQSLDVEGIVPGHGPFDTAGKSLAQTSNYLMWLENALQTYAAQGLDMVEIIETKVPDEFSSMGAMPHEFHRSVSHFFPDIERQSMPLTNR